MGLRDISFALLVIVSLWLNGCMHPPEVIRDDVNNPGSYQYRLNIEYEGDFQNDEYIIYLDNLLHYRGKRNCFIKKPHGMEFCGLNVSGWPFLKKHANLFVAGNTVGASLTMAGHISNKRVEGDVIHTHWVSEKIGTFQITSNFENDH